MLPPSATMPSQRPVMVPAMGVAVNRMSCAAASKAEVALFSLVASTYVHVRFPLDRVPPFAAGSRIGEKVVKLFVGESVTWSVAARLLLVQSLLLPETSLPKSALLAKSRWKPLVPYA